MLLTEDNDMIQAISADRSDKPFCIRIVKSSPQNFPPRMPQHKKSVQ